MKYAHQLGLFCLLILQACSYNMTIPVLQVPTHKNELNLGVAANIGTGGAGAQAVGSYNFIKNVGINAAASAYQTPYTLFTSDIYHTSSRHVECGLHYNLKTKEGRLLIAPAFGMGHGYSGGFDNPSIRTVTNLFYNAYSIRLQYEPTNRLGLSSKFSLLQGRVVQQSNFYPSKNTTNPQYALDNVIYWNFEKNRHNGAYIFVEGCLNTITHPIPGSLNLGLAYNFSTHFKSEKAKE